MIDHTTADVAHHDGVLLAAMAAGDVLLVHDVLTDARAVNDFTAELRILVEEAAEPSAKVCMPSRQDDAASILHNAVGRKACDETVEIARVVGLNVLLDRVIHEWTATYMA